MKFKPFLLAMAATAAACSGPHETQDAATSKRELLEVLEIQEAAYDNQTEENKKKFLATCADSVIFIGGDDGGMMTSAEAYVADLANGYIEKPHDRTFRFHGNTAIAISIHKAYKLLAQDTLFLNVRYTKIFVRENGQWKMTYVTYAPLPILYNKPVKVDVSKLRRYEGIYDIGDNLLDSVFVEDGKIYSEVAHSGKSELIPINDSTFIGHGYFGRAIFGGIPSKPASHYTFEWSDGQRIKFKRVR